MVGYTIWFTGLPSSGKTTIASELVKELKRRKILYVLLDDNKMRKILSPDLKNIKYENYRHIIRLANVSYLIAANNILNIVCTYTPRSVLRKYAKQLIKNYVEIYTCCPLEVCEKRARQKFNGNNSFYEESTTPSLVLDTHNETIKGNVKKVVEYLEKQKILNGEQK